MEKVLKYINQIRSLKLADIKYYDRYLIDMYKNSKKEIFILSIKILIPVLILAILIKYITKRKQDIRYVMMFAWAYCVSAILHITLLGREYRDDVWSKLNEGWGNFSEKELVWALENCIMLFPFTFLLLLGIGRIVFKKSGFITIMLFSLILAFSFSFGIETCQAKFGKGTFQLSDLAYNTFGGVAGGFLYWILAKIRQLLDKLLE